MVINAIEIKLLMVQTVAPLWYNWDISDFLTGVISKLSNGACQIEH